MRLRCGKTRSPWLAGRASRKPARRPCRAGVLRAPRARFNCGGRMSRPTRTRRSGARAHSTATRPYRSSVLQLTRHRSFDHSGRLLHRRHQAARRHVVDHSLVIEHRERPVDMARRPGAARIVYSRNVAVPASRSRARPVPDRRHARRHSIKWHEPRFSSVDAPNSWLTFDNEKAAETHRLAELQAVAAMPVLVVHPHAHLPPCRAACHAG